MTVITQAVFQDGGFFVSLKGSIIPKVFLKGNSMEDGAKLIDPDGVAVRIKIIDDVKTATWEGEDTQYHPHNRW